MIDDRLWYVEACLIAVNTDLRGTPKGTCAYHGLLTAQAYWVARWTRIVEVLK